MFFFFFDLVETPFFSKVGVWLYSILVRRRQLLITRHFSVRFCVCRYLYYIVNARVIPIEILCYQSTHIFYLSYYTRALYMRSICT